MNTLSQLIQQLCPNGVIHKRLGEACSFKRGSTITKKDVTEGDVPVIAGGQKPAYYHNKPNRTGETIAISSSGAYAGFVTYWNIPVFLSDSFSVQPSVNLIVKFAYYYLKDKQQLIHETKKGGGVPHVHGSDIAGLIIPIPPLEVQKEIVNILDKFTQLEAELEAELEARKKQYENYRNRLLKQGDLQGEMRQLTLGDIGKVSMCKRVFREQTSSHGDVPFYKIGTFGKCPDAYIRRELYDEYRAKYSFPKKGDILLSASGTIGRTVVYDGEPAYFQDSNIIWLDHDESIVTNKYLYHLYQTIVWHTEGGTIQRLYNDNLKKITILLPSLAEQERIASLLDKFELLTTDLSTGLPAELNARHRQYEYYRNKLLTFKELAHA